MMAPPLLNASLMQNMMRCNVLVFVGMSLLAMCMAGCGSRGQFIPYTEASTLTQGKPEEASLAVSYDAPNGLFHEPRYDLTLSVKDTGKTIGLGFIMDGDFSAPAKDKVQVTASLKEGMTVKTNDILLQGLIDHVSIALTKTDLKTAKTYGLEIVLYDNSNRVVGRYLDSLVEKAGTAKINSATSEQDESPTSATAIYEWIGSRARMTAPLTSN